MLDAQATGMPVISTTHCDISDEVIHAKTGFLSLEKDVDSLAEHIGLFYKMNNENYQKYARQARDHIEQAFNITNNAAGLLQVYNKVL